MDKQKSLFGWLILGALFLGWFSYNNAKLAKKQMEEQEIARQEAIKDSIENAKNLTTVVVDTVEQATVKPADVPSTVSPVDTGSITVPPVQKVPEELFTLENDELKLTLSNKGGRIVKAEIKGYTSYANYVEGTEPQPHIVLYSDTTSQFSWQIKSGAQLYDSDNIVFNGTQTGDEVTFTTTVNGKPFEQLYALSGKPYIVDYKVNFPDKASEPNLTWQTNFKRQEKDMRGEKEFTFFAYKTAEGDFKKLRATKKDFSKTAEGNLYYLTQRERFFSQTMFSTGTLKDAAFKSTFVDKDDVFSKKLTTTAAVDLTNGNEVPFNFYIGPNERKLLKTVDKDLVNILPKGVLGLPLVKWISGLFKWMMPLSSNMGLIILLMTFIIKLALSPLTYKSYLSQAKMQMLKPELEELRAKHGKDQQRMSQEQMKLYSKAGVNPVGGCLPTLLQIPIFFSLYYFFRTSIFFRQEKFLWAEDLSTYDSVINLPFEIPMMGSHISLFAILYGVALFLSMRFTQSMNGGMTTAGGAGGEMMKTQMKIMQWGMPIFLPVIFNAFPAALTFYYFVYNIINVIQTLVIKKFIIDEEKIKRQIATNKKKVKKKSKFQQRLEEAMKQQQANQQKKKK